LKKVYSRQALLRLKPAYLAVLLTLAATPQQLMAEESAEATANADMLPVVQVAEDRSGEPSSEETGSYTIGTTTSATRLDTSIKETPQSVSVITRAQMDDFRLNSINDVLDFATGIKVERVEPDRSYYTARGSDITNFQIDGIGTPFAYGLVFGDIDTAAYDRIEVLRGANGLLTGTGNPSATINFIRKRPTADFQLEVDTSVGSWGYRRVDLDVSGPINEAGNVRGRLVLANQNRGSYLDNYSSERNVAYGIIEADITDQTSVAFGHTYQQNDASGTMWGSLPLLYADGTKRHYKRSDSTAADWTYWDTINNITFAELTHEFDNAWKIKTQLTRKEISSDSRLLYIFGNENRATGAGLFAWPGEYHDQTEELIADAYLTGPFTLGGREHELVFGTSWSRSDTDETENSADYGVMALANFDAAANVPKPNFVSSGSFAKLRNKRSNSYLATKLNVTDALKLTMGANLLSYELEGESYGAPQNADAHDKVTPYMGAVYHLNEQYSLYSSYTGIYNPQFNLDANLQPLAPIEGKNYEAGIKGEFFDKQLNASFALFNNIQENVAEQIGTIGITAIHRGIEADTKGYEFDVSGEITSNLKINGGYTRLMSVKDEDDNNVKSYIPRQMLHLSAVYKVPYIDKLKVGASVNWQDDIHVDIGTVRYKQDSYALVNMMADYEIDQHWSTALNVYNLTDEKYLASMMWGSYGQSYYGAPRNAMATVTWKY
jgi:outer membrane receptor for ferric coprogen and ferric-rhodotorulic acid